MEQWAAPIGLGMAAIWITAGIYGETQRHRSAWWRGWTDVSGLRLRNWFRR